MDESWRMRMGMPSLTGRRGVSEDFTSWTSAESGSMDAEDFKDVFGGPPKSVLNRNLSCTFNSYDYFYNEIFRRPEDEKERRKRTGRRLPEFSIPASSPAIEEKAYDHERKEKKSSSSLKLWRSMSMSKWNLKSKLKSNSSSVLSYEEIREDDVALTSYASKLRPINVPCRWNSPTAKNQSSEKPFQYPQTSYSIENYYPPNEYTDEHFMSSSNHSYLQQPYSTTVGIPVDEIDELESPSSANSRFCCNPESVEEDEYLSSYVIEINSRENEAADIDEAIAWAKGKYQLCDS